jgi:EAL domain-containing protein (putative c-di-GMP-specific phosphodiesterase class I)
MNANLVHYVKTREALAQAIEHEEFELRYQPQVSLRDGRVVGVEALIRWRRPGHGLIPPAAFIGAAETGLIVPIGRWVLPEACRQAAAWRAAGWTDMIMAVNLSAVRFRRRHLEADVAQALAASGLPPRCLELELTEYDPAAERRSPDGDDEALEGRRHPPDQVDDFGTGYSVLAYLKRLNVHKLEIDRSVLVDLRQDEQDDAIVRAIVQIARGLNLETVGEGIEDDDVAALLRGMGCDDGEGYLCARPQPAAESWA